MRPTMPEHRDSQPLMPRKGYAQQTPARVDGSPLRVYGGGRTWWARFAFTRINIAPTILCRKIEDLGETRFSVWQSTTAASTPHDVGFVFAVAMASRRTTVSDSYRAPPRALPESID